MLVGVDIGGTKTHIRAIDATGHHRDLNEPSTSWCINGLFGDAANPTRLVGLIHQLTGGHDPSVLDVGAHGVDTPEARRMLTTQLEAVQSGHVTVSNDAELLVPASGHDQGIAVIAGTGSVVVASFADRESIVVGGHGWLFGDPGSAPGLVREAVKAILTRRDQRLGPEPLGAKLIAHFGVADETELQYRLSVSPRLDEWAQAASLVFEAADDGSQLAADVIDDGARGLAEGIHTADTRGARLDVIVCAGGVMTNQPRLFAALRAHVRTWRPDVDLQLFTDAPVAGALARAQRRGCRP